MNRLGSWVPTVLVLAGLAWLLSSPGFRGQEAAIAATNRVAAGFTSQVERTLDVKEALGTSRKEVVALIRQHQRLATSWQLESSLAAEMKDDEVFEYVTSRANTYVIINTALLAVAPVGASPNDDVFQRIRRQAWTATSLGSLQLSQNGAYLTDREGQPKKLAQMNDLREFWALQRNFNMDFRQGLLLQISKEPATYRTNMALIEREHAGTLREVVWLRRTAGLPEGARFYSVNAPKLTLTLIAQHSDAEAKIVFVSPLSW